LRVVLDTNILVRAHGRSSTQARELLRELLKHGHCLVISNEILAEVTKVLRYPRFQALYGLTESDLLNYIQFLQSISHVVNLDPQYHAPLRDPNDLIVLQTAEKGEADFLCTQDADFYDQTTLSYCAARGIEVCNEQMFLLKLAQTTGQQ
jgi:putative PIN family toxin of toxin-antitoxin system